MGNRGFSCATTLTAPETRVVVSPLSGGHGLTTKRSEQRVIEDHFASNLDLVPLGTVTQRL
jgi:hypothetical protein